MIENNFWQTISYPIFGLSPMDGVTDQPYRFIQKKYGQPDIVYTEFTSVEGVCHGASRLLIDFLFDETQRPIVAQIYGTTPDFFRQTAIILCELGFDGIDINMGCPAKNVAHSGAGAALIKTPDLAREIILATQQGVIDYQNGLRAKDCPNINKEITKEVERRHELLSEEYKNKKTMPISVKTRVGFDQIVTEDWINNLLSTNALSAIALHGRTLRQQYSGFANWEEIAKAAVICKSKNVKLLGNGDVKSFAEAKEKVSKYGVDGVLIGRASFGNPYVYKEDYENQKNIYEISLEHCQIYEKTYNNDNEKTYFLPMRKHLGWYVSAFPNAKEVRLKLFQTNSAEEVQQVLKEYNLI